MNRRKSPRGRNRPTLGSVSRLPLLLAAAAVVEGVEGVEAAVAAAGVAALGR